MAAFSALAPAVATCAGLPPVAQPMCFGLGGNPTDIASSVAGGVASRVATSVFESAVGVVVDGASWLLDRVGEALDSSTRIDVHTAWFGQHFAVMVTLAATACCAFLLLGAAGTLVHQDPRRLGRGATAVATAGVGTGCVVAITGLLLTATDELCTTVTGGTGADVTRALHGPATVLTALVGSGGVSAAVGQTKVPLFVVLLLALVVAAACLVIWLELLLRSAAVYAAVLFLPLALAGLTWSATGRWAARLARTLVALIAAKFVIVAILSMSASAVASGTADGAAGVLAGAAMLVLATFAPFLLFRITGVFDDGGGHSALDGARSRGMWHAIYAGSSTLRTVQSLRQHRSSSGGGKAGRAGRSAAAKSPATLVVAGAYTAGRAATRAAYQGVRRASGRSGPTPPRPGRGDR